MKIFSGSSHPLLAKEVAKNLKTSLSRAQIVRFSNSEVKVTIQEEVKNKDCVIIQSTNKPTDENLMELFLFCDALYRSEARKVIGVIPYFGYARQERQHQFGECVSANVIIRFLEVVGFSKIYTIDIHNEATAGVFNIPFKNITAFPFLALKIREELKKKKINPSQVSLVAPDYGAIENVRVFGKAFYQKDNFPFVVIEKYRFFENKEETKTLGIYGKLNPIVIIVDDMIVSGSTLFPAIDLCLKNGAKMVLAAVIHHDFPDKTIPKKIQNSSLTAFFSTNTIFLPPDYRFPKLIEFSVASLIAKELS